jgi:hypothetical protein
MEDVRFEPNGPVIDINDIARLTATPDPTNCTLCIDKFTGYDAVEWSVVTASTRCA